MARTRDVFLNFPFDESFRPLRDAMMFAVLACGYRPRCALEEQDSGRPRLERLYQLIGTCGLGIHDISRTELDGNQLPRFNMPFELGLFLGAARFGDSAQKKKRCLILDRESYRYQLFLSDLAGNDPAPHHDDPERVIRLIRDFLSAGPVSAPKTPTTRDLLRLFNEWLSNFPAICAELAHDPAHLSWKDRANSIEQWLAEHRGPPRRRRNVN